MHASPGIGLPSKNSKKAPPPVEIWLKWCSKPNLKTAAALSPPPIIVVVVLGNELMI